MFPRFEKAARNIPKSLARFDRAPREQHASVLHDQRARARFRIVIMPSVTTRAALRRKRDALLQSRAAIGAKKILHFCIAQIVQIGL
jgi:hypothetical protein